MEILKQKMLHNNFCQQHDHTAAMSLLNHFHFESFLSHVTGLYIYIASYTHPFLLSSTLMFIL